MDNLSCKNDVVNRALSLLRENEIVDFTNEPSSDTEKLVYKWYETAKAEAITEIEPVFAIKRFKLAREKVVDIDDLTEIRDIAVEENDNGIIKAVFFAYRIPNDCLKILEGNFELIEGNYIYSYQSNSLPIKYLSSDTELYSREVKFNLALSYIIAYYICADLQNNDSKIQMFLKLKNLKISEARTNNLREIGVEIRKNYRWKKWC